MSRSRFMFSNTKDAKAYAKFHKMTRDRFYWRRISDEEYYSMESSLSKAFIKRRFKFFNDLLIKYSRKPYYLRFNYFSDEFKLLVNVVNAHNKMLDKIRSDKKHVQNYSELNFVFGSKYKEEVIGRRLKVAFKRAVKDKYSCSNNKFTKGKNYNIESFVINNPIMENPVIRNPIVKKSDNGDSNSRKFCQIV